MGAVCLENSYLARSSLPAKEELHEPSSELGPARSSEDSSPRHKEEFHDASDDVPQPEGASQALVLQYNKWAPESPDYRNVDAQVR